MLPKFSRLGPNLTFNLSSMNSKDRLEYNTIETNNEYFEELSVQPDCNYYQTHDFHKLAMKPGKLKTTLKVLIFTRTNFRAFTH